MVQGSDAPASLFGIDCYSLFESKRDLIAFLSKHDPEFAKEVRGRLSFLDKFATGHEYGEATMFGGLSRIAGHLQDVMEKIQARLQWGSDRYDCSALERLAAEQNCEVVLAADEYYRKCASEPAGSQASWNTRDQHMTTTLLRIQAHLQDPKIIVWAHNSHVGDSTATNRGATPLSATRHGTSVKWCARRLERRRSGLSDSIPLTAQSWLRSTGEGSMRPAG